MSFFSKKDNDELFSLLEDQENKEFTDEIQFGKTDHQERSHALTPEEVIGKAEQTVSETANNALEALKQRMGLEQKSEPIFDIESTFDTATPPKKEEIKEVREENKEKVTLLEKCRPYIIDDKGNDTSVNSAPTYRLKSVAEILESESKKTLDKLSEKYDISFDDLGKYSSYIKPEPIEEILEEPDEKEVFEDIIASNTITQVQTNVTVISDIDNTFPEKPKAENLSNTATIKFTPITGGDNVSRISVSSQTRQLDLTGELTGIAENSPDADETEVQLEQTEFEDYIPTEEFSDLNDTKNFLRKFSLIKRNSFLKMVSTVFIALVFGFGRLPFMSEIILSETKLSNIICAGLLGIIILINADMLLSLKTALSKKQSPDICGLTASLSVLLYAIIAIFNNESALDLSILCAVILSFRSICRFLGSSQRLTSFKQISSTTPKKAVKLIDDKATTFAMAKASVEGDALIAAPQKVSHIGDFMKYSTFGAILSGKIPIISIVSILISLAVGFACASYFDGAVYGFYSAAVIQCFAALPIIFFIDNLPLYSSSKHLNSVGAMIAGKMGAQQIENANAVVFSSADLFPSGTVSLHQLKVLSDNSIDDTIIRAASLTEALNSPLTTIFKKIAGTGGDIIFPESDTVKYEDRMGISGWVDNKLLFVGNRALMEAHGISVPSLNVDRKILRQGFFPVYVASEDKACALLIVQYTVRPEIARELRRISALGVTMLIDNSDPNMTEEMICDYIGLYEDSVRIMSNAGCHMYKNSVVFAESASAPAAYKGSALGLAAIISSANKIKKSNILLTVLYVLLSVLGAVLFSYMSFDGSGALTNGATVLLYSLASTVISYILYLTQKP